MCAWSPPPEWLRKRWWPSPSPAVCCKNSAATRCKKPDATSRVICNNCEPTEPMVYPIVRYGHPVLETPAAKVSGFGTEELRKLIADMFESMYAAHGVGLAAPQI